MENVLDNLTEKHTAMLKQYRKNLEDILQPDHTDYILLRFLKGGNFNLKKCERVFRKTYNNILSFGLDKILETYEKPEVIQRFQCVGILGFAKDRTLIRYVACGHLDFYGFIMSMSAVDICLYMTYEMESDIKALKDENIRTGENIHEVTYVLDLEGFSIQQVLHKIVIEQGIEYLCLGQDSYPDIWKNILIINAPTIFDVAFNIFKPFFGSTLNSKFRIADKSSSKDLLLKYIDEDVLPAFLGGTRVDSNGDPRCKEFITFGGKVPEKFYSRHHKIPLMPTDPDVKCFTLRPRSTHNHCVVVREPGSRLRSQFRTEGGSVYAVIFFKEFIADSDNGGFPAEDEYLDENADNFKYKQISHRIREQGHCTQEDIIINCVSSGIYIFNITNISNWFTSRKILIKTELLPS